MPRKIRQLKADLRRAGFTMRPGKGSHTVWEHPLVPDDLTLAGHDGDDAKPYQEKDVRTFVEAARQAEENQEG
jgi:predicted RNA binding protein YcfA (HicA-like mRNA interferase family)